MDAHAVSVAPEGEEPLYEHHCPHCVFLGQYEGHDLYACERGHLLKHPTVLARHSDHLNDYTQGTEFADVDTVIMEAVWRAKGAGLL